MEKLLSIYTKLNVYRYYIGRPGQSFDPKVRAVRAADDVTKVLKFLLDWVRRYRHVVPPFPLYYAWFKCYYFYQRVIRFLKRKLNRK